MEIRLQYLQHDDFNLSEFLFSHGLDPLLTVDFLHSCRSLAIAGRVM
jgi:hypothetical protein